MTTYTVHGIGQRSEGRIGSLFTAGFRTQLLLCVKRPVRACCESTVKLVRSALSSHKVPVSVIFRHIELKVFFCPTNEDTEDLIEDYTAFTSVVRFKIKVGFLSILFY